mmetsp:Transcript_15967/g.62375  ORF Transcript_15967/g.62375 Transcript_15967/m.62375 type:complete len:374 (-) Transcript_15967:1118-2239(-)
MRRGGVLAVRCSCIGCLCLLGLCLFFLCFLFLGLLCLFQSTLLLLGILLEVLQENLAVLVLVQPRHNVLHQLRRQSLVHHLRSALQLFRRHNTIVVAVDEVEDSVHAGCDVGGLRLELLDEALHLVVELGDELLLVREPLRELLQLARILELLLHNLDRHLLEHLLALSLGQVAGHAELERSLLTSDLHVVLLDLRLDDLLRNLVGLLAELGPPQIQQTLQVAELLRLVFQRCVSGELSHRTSDGLELGRGECDGALRDVRLALDPVQQLLPLHLLPRLLVFELFLLDQLCLLAEHLELQRAVLQAHFCHLDADLVHELAREMIESLAEGILRGNGGRDLERVGEDEKRRREVVRQRELEPLGELVPQEGLRP